MTDTNIFYETGDIQFSTCQTIVVPVNCEGTMNKGMRQYSEDAILICLSVTNGYVNKVFLPLANSGYTIPHRSERY